MTNHTPGTGYYPQPLDQQPSTQPGWQPAAPVARSARPGRRFLAESLTAIVSSITGAGRDAGTTTSPRPIITVIETTQTESVHAATQTVTRGPMANLEGEGGPQSAFSGDGQHLVGEGIEPGTYKRAGADSSNCYWASLKNAFGEFDALIVNDNPQRQIRVALKKGEFFEASGCQGWKRVG
ncbi:hypothetical protein AB0M50_25120 [Nonomuraea fuscirosea]|uniref:hypothetical protein n=1 Tax=Nonomuraea fuscirosea TaxID=1291556 RepID=UPI00343DEEC8